MSTNTYEINFWVLCNQFRFGFVGNEQLGLYVDCFSSFAKSRGEPATLCVMNPDALETQCRPAWILFLPSATSWLWCCNCHLPPIEPNMFLIISFTYSYIRDKQTFLNIMWTSNFLYKSVMILVTLNFVNGLFGYEHLHLKCCNWANVVVWQSKLFGFESISYLY